jgi:hypothetical protein
MNSLSTAQASLELGQLLALMSLCYFQNVMLLQQHEDTGSVRKRT